MLDAYILSIKNILMVNTILAKYDYWLNSILIVTIIGIMLIYSCNFLLFIV